MTPFSSTPAIAHPKVIVIGAGPAGCLLALLLAKQGATVSIYELRDDLRVEAETGALKQRSISLSLSSRGLSALDSVGLVELFRGTSVPMYGRCIHKNRQPLEFHPYGQPEQHLLSISRTQLTCGLVDQCDKHPFISLHFNAKCKTVDLDAPSITTVNAEGEETVVSGDLVVGADGAHSRVRETMLRRDGFDFSKSFFDAAYKELPFTMDTTKGYPKEVLHIWPRGGTLLIALPNTSKTTNNFTATLFMPKEKFDVLDSPKKVTQFFEETFPDTKQAMPTVADDFMKNPMQSLYTIRCSPFNYKGKAVLIGDAAHTIVPFYGQGCNASLEDSLELGNTIAEYGWERLSEALEDYGRTRKPNADAIADLAIRQYRDMSTRSTSVFFVGKRRVEILLNWMFPTWFLPLYSMVAFSSIPYADAVSRAKRQDSMLASMVAFGVPLLVVVVALVMKYSSMVEIA